MPKPEESQGTTAVEPNRLRLIRERLHGDFYHTGEASERIASAVLAALKDFERTSLPH